MASIQRRKTVAALIGGVRIGSDAPVVVQSMTNTDTGNVMVDLKDNSNFRAMIEVAVEDQEPERIGVNWGSLDQPLLTSMMDENSRLEEPKDAREVTMEAMVVSALNSAALAEKYGLRPEDRKSTRLNSSHDQISYAVFC